MPTCAACAIVTAIESIVPEFEGSYLFLHYNAAMIGGRQGVSIKTAFLAAHRFGICHEDLWHSMPDALKKKPSRKAYEDAKRLRPKLPLPVETHDEKVECLNYGRPLVITYKPKIFDILKIPSSEVVAVRHTSAIVRYDPSKDAFLTRNSWGKFWGRNGSFWLPRAISDDPDLCTSCFAVTV